MVSEFMLQQTVVKTVIPFFNRFVHKWQNVRSLSRASEDELLKHWQGLGYYSRARNLLKTAKIISRDFNGIIPNNQDELIRLPGIGEYASAAILAIAYNKPSVVIDGNIKRVISRYLGIKGTLENNKKIIENAAQKLSVEKNNQNYSQGMMELGALVCTPKSPSCEICPVSETCISYKLNIQNQVPEPKKSIKKKKLYCSSVLLLKNNKDILLKKRTSKILNNQWDLPSSEWNNQEVDEITGLCLIENIKYKKSKDLYRHIFSHIDLKIRIYFGKIKSSKIEKNNKSYKWVSLNELDKYPTTLICRNILKNYKLI
jgi:A/G-specific adenine glycosylase